MITIVNGLCKPTCNWGAPSYLPYSWMTTCLLNSLLPCWIRYLWLMIGIYSGCWVYGQYNQDHIHDASSCCNTQRIPTCIIISSSPQLSQFFVHQQKPNHKPIMITYKSTCFSVKSCFMLLRSNGSQDGDTTLKGPCWASRYGCCSQPTLGEHQHSW